ncbi:hypothetical protein PIB30_025362 [Stylosanthes scabra]|uniref:Uncharacterized protein n=1 Tax=Stylosanthes scabra TaxID=79078 RepID=A0ABU6Y8U5_9FABA|nr:hypothetical protein [Stylosanthes scabra]
MPSSRELVAIHRGYFVIAFSELVLNFVMTLQLAVSLPSPGVGSPMASSFIRALSRTSAERSSSSPWTLLLTTSLVEVFCRSRAHGASGKQPSPRKSRPPPRRSAEPHSKPAHYEFMGLANGHNGHLDRLEQELAQQREVERKLQDELCWRREAEEKIRKLEEGLK